MADLCHCDEASDPEEGHEHCPRCDCVLRSDEGGVCCWCEERED